MLKLSNVPWDTAPRRSTFESARVFDPCDMTQYSVVARIGSESANARVYEIVTEDGVRYALKAMYAGDDEARRAVLMGRTSNHFAYAVAHGRCLAELNPRDHVHRRMRTQHVLSVLDKTTPESVVRKRLRAAVSHAIRTDASLSEILEIASQRGGNVVALRSALLDPVPVTVLVSELLWSDLKAILGGVVDVPANFGSRDAVVAGIVADVLDTVRKMVDLGFAHRDLHTGNVLLRRGKDRFRGVVHDFGTSGDSANLDEHKDDVRTFVNAVGISSDAFEPLVEETLRAVNEAETKDDLVRTLVEAAAAWRVVS